MDLLSNREFQSCEDLEKNRENINELQIKVPDEELKICKKKKKSIALLNLVDSFLMFLKNRVELRPTAAVMAHF